MALALAFTPCDVGSREGTERNNTLTWVLKVPLWVVFRGGEGACCRMAKWKQGDQLESCAIGPGKKEGDV